MALKNQDGSVYRLTGYNPLPKTQDNWADEIVVHNMNWKESVRVDEEEGTPLPPPPKRPETAAPVVVPAPTPPPAPSVNLKNVALLHCLPGTIREHHDDLYGETRQTIQYGNKMLIEAIVIYRDTFSFKFWTTGELSKGTIIYPSRYRDGSKFDDFQWYKVVATQADSGGFITDTIISGYHPDFSE